MKEKRLFRRNDAASAPGTLLAEGRSYPVIFDNLSLVGARVRSDGEKLPPPGSPAVLTMTREGGAFQVECRVVGIEEGNYYRLKFDGFSEGSLNNLMALLRSLGRGSYNPEEELPKLTLELT